METITASDWNAALETYVAAEIERLGGRPTWRAIARFFLALGPQREQRRTRALLVYCAELTWLLPAAHRVRDVTRRIHCARR